MGCSLHLTGSGSLFDRVSVQVDILLREGKANPFLVKGELDAFHQVAADTPKIGSSAESVGSRQVR
jgi:hypothetical protein